MSANQVAIECDRLLADGDGVDLADFSDLALNHTPRTVFLYGVCEELIPTNSTRPQSRRQVVAKVVETFHNNVLLPLTEQMKRGYVHAKELSC